MEMIGPCAGHGETTAHIFNQDLGLGVESTHYHFTGTCGKTNFNIEIIPMDGNFRDCSKPLTNFVLSLLFLLLVSKPPYVA